MRKFFAALAGACLLALGACTATAPATIPQLVTDVQSVDAGLQASLAQLAATQGIDPAAIAQARALLADVDSAAAAVVAADAPSASQGQQLIAAANALLAFVATLPGLPPALAGLFSAAAVLVPVIAAELGIAANPA